MDVDLVIFGATGYTGRCAAAEMIHLSEDYPELKWAIAGRSERKLLDLKADLAEKTGKNLNSVCVIIADVMDEESLRIMCNRTRVVVNCCGPYYLYGRAVVDAAVECHTNYIDISGEPQFMESMLLRHNRRTSEDGVFVICACGMDSIPADMGVVTLQNSFGGTLNAVEAYVSAELPQHLWFDAFRNGIVNYATWSSLVNGLVNKNKLPALRKSLYPEKLPDFEPKLATRWVHKKDGKWCVLFPTADASVVYRTQRFAYKCLKQRPVQFKGYLELSTIGFLGAVLIGMLLWLMTLSRFTAPLLLKFPRLFSLGLVSTGGPSEVVNNATRFQLELRGTGWQEGSDVANSMPNKRMTLKVTGTNPGYGATVVALLLSAITILKEPNNMPAVGGVYTTGTAFRNTNLVKNLNERGIKFTIADSSNWI